MEKAFETALRLLLQGNAAEMDDALAEAVQADDDNDIAEESLPQITASRTFEEAGVLTRDRGLELTLSTGERVFITIQVQ